MPSLTRWNCIRILSERENLWQTKKTTNGSAISSPTSPPGPARQKTRSEPYNSEDLPGARLTFGVQREDPPSAADLLHVRQGKNYLVDDYTRMASLNQSSEVMDILRQMRKDLGFDRVRAYEPGAMEPKDVAFSRWKHPLKPMARKSVLKELRESRPKETVVKPPRKHKERGRE